MDLAFDASDHERIDVYEGDDLRIIIDRLCEKRNIREQSLKDKILEIVELQVNNVKLKSEEVNICA